MSYAIFTELKLKTEPFLKLSIPQLAAGLTSFRTALEFSMEGLLPVWVRLPNEILRPMQLLTMGLVKSTSEVHLLLLRVDSSLLEFQRILVVRITPPRCIMDNGNC